MIPSYWVHPEDVVLTTAYHRTVPFDCEALVSKDAAVLVEQQMRLLERYQAQGGFRLVTAGDPLQRGASAHFAAIRLDVRERRMKFKLSQNRSPVVRAKIVDEPRKRGPPNDTRAADALQRTIGRELGK